MKDEHAEGNASVENGAVSVPSETLVAAGSGGSATTPTYPSTPMQIVLVISLMLAMFIISLDSSIIATAIPTITQDFHSTSDVGWYGSAFFVGLAMFQGLWAKAYQNFGQKIIFLACILIFEIGSLVVATAPNSTAVIIGRAVQGLGGAGVTSGCYLIVAFIVPIARLSIVMGLFGVVWTLSSIAGPLLGGVLTTDLSWRWCFWINLPVGGAAFLGILIFFRTPNHARFGKATPWRQWHREFDVLGIVVGLGSWICLLLALQTGGVEHAWRSAYSIGLLIGFGLLVICFVFVEWYQGDSAMTPTRLLKNRTVAACAAYNLLATCGMIVRTYTLPTYFQAVLGTSAATSGIRTLPSVLSTAIAALASATALGKIGYYLPFLWVGGILNAVGSGIYYLFAPNSTAAQWIGYQITVGVGAGIVIQVPVMVMQRISSPKDMSMTVGIMMFTQFVGGGFGVSAGQAIVNNRLIETLPSGRASVNPSSVLNAGATGLRQAFPDPRDLATVVNSYMVGLRDAWILSTAALSVSLLVLFAAEWRSIKKETSHNVDPSNKEATTNAA